MEKVGFSLEEYAMVVSESSKRCAISVDELMALHKELGKIAKSVSEVAQRDCQKR